MISEAVPPKPPGTVVRHLATLCEAQAVAQAGADGALKADFDRLLSASTEQLQEKLREDLRQNPEDVQLWPSPDLTRDELSIPASDMPHACTHWTREGLAVMRGEREGIQPALAIARVFVRRFRASRSQPHLPGIDPDPQVSVRSLDSVESVLGLHPRTSGRESGSLNDDGNADADADADNAHSFLIRFKLSQPGEAACDFHLRFTSQRERDRVLGEIRAMKSAQSEPLGLSLPQSDNVELICHPKFMEYIQGGEQLPRTNVGTLTFCRDSSRELLIWQSAFASLAAGARSRTDTTAIGAGWCYSSTTQERAQGGSAAWIPYPLDVSRQLDRAILQQLPSFSVSLPSTASASTHVIDLVLMEQRRVDDCTRRRRVKPPAQLQRHVWQAQHVSEIEPLTVTATEAFERWHCTGRAQKRRWKIAQQNPRWLDESIINSCMGCAAAISKTGILGASRHHCRRCGWVFCGKCTNNTIDLDCWLHQEKPHALTYPPSGNGSEHPAQPQAHRVCTDCFRSRAKELGRYHDTSNSMAVLGCASDSEIETFDYSTKHAAKFIVVRDTDRDSSPRVLVEAFDPGRTVSTADYRLGSTLVICAPSSSGKWRWEALYDDEGRVAGQVELRIESILLEERRSQPPEAPQRQPVSTLASSGSTGSSGSSSAARCSWMWADAGISISLAMKNPLRWTSGEPALCATKLETEASAKRCPDRKVLVRYPAAGGDTSPQEFANVAAALAFFRQLDSSSTEAEPEPEQEPEPEPEPDAEQALTLSRIEDRLHKCRQKLELVDSDRKSMDVAKLAMELRADAKRHAGDPAVMAAIATQIDQVAEQAISRAEQLKADPWEVSRGFYYEFEASELNPCKELLSQFDEAVEAILSWQPGRAQQNACWLLCDLYQAQLETSILHMRRSGWREQELSPDQFGKVGEVLLQFYGRLIEHGSLEEARAEAHLHTLMRELYARSVDGVTMGSKYATMLKSCLTNTLRNETARELSTTCPHDVLGILKIMMEELTRPRSPLHACVLFKAVATTLAEQVERLLRLPQQGSGDDDQPLDSTIADEIQALQQARRQEGHFSALSNSGSAFVLPIRDAEYEFGDIAKQLVRRLKGQTPVDGGPSTAQVDDDGIDDCAFHLRYLVRVCHNLEDLRRNFKALCKQLVDPLFGEDNPECDGQMRQDVKVAAANCQKALSEGLSLAWKEIGWLVVQANPTLRTVLAPASVAKANWATGRIMEQEILPAVNAQIAALDDWSRRASSHSNGNADEEADHQKLLQKVLEVSIRALTQVLVDALLEPQRWEDGRRLGSGGNGSAEWVAQVVSNDAQLLTVYLTDFLRADDAECMLRDVNVLLAVAELLLAPLDGDAFVAVAHARFGESLIDNGALETSAPLEVARRVLAVRDCKGRHEAVALALAREAGCCGGWTR